MNKECIGINCGYSITRTGTSLSSCIYFKTNNYGIRQCVNLTRLQDLKLKENSNE